MKGEINIWKLRKEINERIKRSYNSLLTNDIASAREHIEWVDTATNIIGRVQKRSGRLAWPLSIGLISVFFLGLGLFIRIPQTNISLDLETAGVNFILRSDWILNYRFSLSELDITNLKDVEAPATEIKVKSEQPFNMNLKGRAIIIDDLSFSANADISLRFSVNNLSFIVKNDTLAFNLLVGEGHLVLDQHFDDSLNFDIPELFFVRSFPSTAVPVNVMFADTSNWVLKDINASEINFLEESPAGSGKFISLIREGNVKILETDRVTKLEEGDLLVIENLKTRRIQISKSNAGLKIHLEGEVSEVSAGTQFFEKPLNPTILEYLYHAKSIAFFWSCLVFLCSFLWSIKNTIFTGQP